MTTLHFALAFIAAMAAGLVNAIAGGGTLITFPVLTFLGIPAVVANVTNTIALCPGYLGGFFAQMKQLKGREKELWLLIPASIIGGIGGGALLLVSGESTFRTTVPYLILLAALLLSIQDPLRKWMNKRAETKTTRTDHRLVMFLSIGLAAVYGGYFGAGVSVIVLAILGLVIDRPLSELNTLKQVISFTINVSASVFFVFSGKIDWTLALVMAIGAILGGMLGGKLAGKLKPQVLRWTVVSISVIVAIIYFVK